MEVRPMWSLPRPMLERPAAALPKLTVTRSLMAIFGFYENASEEIDSGVRFSTLSTGYHGRTRLDAADAVHLLEV